MQQAEVGPPRRVSQREVAREKVHEGSAISLRGGLNENSGRLVHDDEDAVLMNDEEGIHARRRARSALLREGENLHSIPGVNRTGGDLDPLAVEEDTSESQKIPGANPGEDPAPLPDEAIQPDPVVFSSGHEHQGPGL